MTRKTVAVELFAVTVYSGALVCSSFLMFFIEPFVARLLLPVLGGGPGVWNTCVFFFQIVLLLGYLYAHWFSKLRVSIAPVVAHLLIVWFSLLFLPIRFWQAEPQATSSLPPALWLLISLTGMVGCVFFSISTTAPLLQRWFSELQLSRSTDPYFLFAASNFGGLLGLLSYPFLIEPNLTLSEQGQTLTILYAIFALLVSLAGMLKVRRRGDVTVSAEQPPEHSTAAPSPRVCAKWLLLTAIPSSLVLGLTEHVTGELSAVPLFWIVPLAIYLISFIIVFSRGAQLLVTWSTFAAPLLVAFSVLLLASENIYRLLGGHAYVTTGISLQLLTLLTICIACHGKVAADRPARQHLTMYYLIISIGGVIGSAFNALVAPFVFKSGNEYSIVLMAAAIMLSQIPPKLLSRFVQRSSAELASRDVVTPLVVLMVSALCWYVYALTCGGFDENQHFLRPESALLEILLRFGLPVSTCFFLARSNKQYQFGLLALCTIVLLHLHSKSDKNVVYKCRNFFSRLAVSAFDNTAELWNGANLHGTESLNPLKRGKPDAYLYTDGPIGLALNELDKVSFETEDARSVSAELSNRRKYIASLSNSKSQLPPIAVMGLGCGVASCLAKPGERVVFYEINPQVVEIAENPFFFTYIYAARKRKADIKIVTGDARISMQRAPYGAYRLILSDAFSGSSIPTHLVTLEAIQMYLKKLQPSGVLAFNVTGYYDLRRVLSRAALALNLHALTIREYDRTSNERDYIEWVMLVRDSSFAETLRKQGWTDLKRDPSFRLWTDDYSNPLKVLKERFS